MRAWLHRERRLAALDTAIAAWESKDHYQVWRPVTGIREARAAGLYDGDDQQIDLRATNNVSQPVGTTLSAGATSFSSRAARPRCLPPPATSTAPG